MAKEREAALRDRESQIDPINPPGRTNTPTEPLFSPEESFPDAASARQYLMEDTAIPGDPTGRRAIALRILKQRSQTVARNQVPGGAVFGQPITDGPVGAHTKPGQFVQDALRSLMSPTGAIGAEIGGGTSPDPSQLLWKLRNSGT